MALARKAAVLVFGLLLLLGGIALSRTGQAEEKKSHKVLCSYFYFGTQRNLCGDPPLDEVKKRCDEEASRERGEKTECACTQDANYIKDACD